jgi:hypothetical protein
MPSVLANQTIVNRDGNELNNPHFAFRRHTSQGVNPFDIDLPEPPEPDEDEEYELDFGEEHEAPPNGIDEESLPSDAAWIYPHAINGVSSGVHLFFEEDYNGVALRMGATDQSETVLSSYILRLYMVEDNDDSPPKLAIGLFDGPNSMYVDCGDTTYIQTQDGLLDQSFGD